jgi:hypothetical protein
MSEHEFFDDMDGDLPPPREELAVWLSEFMSATIDAENMYRNHYCTMMANRIFEEFGHEGFCEMMIAMDKKAGWISDIIIENSDIDDILFKKYGVYDRHALAKARESKSIEELNAKIWRLRRKYAKQIAEELMTVNSGESDEDDE